MSGKDSSLAASALCLVLLSSWCAIPIDSLADGPKDNIPDQVRRIPPEGIELPEEKRKEMLDLRHRLGDAIAQAAVALQDQPELQRLLPDVEIYHKAVSYAMDFNEFHKEKEFDVALEQLRTGLRRAEALEAGDPYWLREKGRVVRGYRSRIDGSAQPYGLEIPESYRFDGDQSHRLDFWFHGRGEKLSEVAFMEQRRSQPGKFAPVEALVLHPYGRYSNANKFAGEVDLFEALDHPQRDYRIDEDRILVRGFSMGGAACWQFAVHYSDRWAAAQPGAGFSETPHFLTTFQGEKLEPRWWEPKLWRLYDCVDWAVNLSNCPTLAYSGELDRQKQAADMMEGALRREGMTLSHIIGPEMGHKFDPASKIEIERRLASLAEQGRAKTPRVVRFVTWTLRYDRMHWLRVDALTEHWEKGRIDAEWAFPNALFATVEGIDRFSVVFEPGTCPLDPTLVPVAEINGHALHLPGVMSDRSWEVTFVRKGETWTTEGGEDAAPLAEAGGLRKKHGLQGPIDDAFMDRFLFVVPAQWTDGTQAAVWSKSEMERAVVHWRQQFRGDARVKADVNVTEEDIASSHLILWGGPGDNALLDRVLPEIPIQWSEEGIVVDDRRYDGKHHAVIAIYPNPLNPEKYVVLNSSFTYREYAYLNNARQVPMLPDWAVVDLREKPGTQWPGKIVEAGFFDENWQLKPAAQ